MKREREANGRWNREPRRAIGKGNARVDHSSVYRIRSILWAVLCPSAITFGKTLKQPAGKSTPFEQMSCGILFNLPWLSIMKCFRITFMATFVASRPKKHSAISVLIKFRINEMCFSTKHQQHQSTHLFEMPIECTCCIVCAPRFMSTKVLIFSFWLNWIKTITKCLQ